MNDRLTMPAATPWHKASFDAFLHNRLPLLLQERLPLLAYQAEPNDKQTWRVRVVLAADGDEIELAFEGLPGPDEAGLFVRDDEPLVVVPVASRPELDRAEIRCVGEQLYDYVEKRLGQAPSDLAWDTGLARAWLPLDTWLDEFLRDYGQHLDRKNWLSRHTHLRRLLVQQGAGAIYAMAPGQMGRVCPFETAEGPNMGRVLTIASGAEIRGPQLMIVDDRPPATLGLSASAIPLLEHDDANRLLMGANMLRQWVPQPAPEPALVQAGLEPDGLEPDAAEFWAGRNLLTAFLSWGADTYADGIVVSESCARRFDAPYPLEAGDKMANRHGTKGVVSRVLPDDEMPHLAGGTPVDLVYNFIGLHVRLNFGQVREALLGRIAHEIGKPIVVPPFGAPDEEELRALVQQSGLSEMETLRRGKNGPSLERPSTVGWVYWGRLFHLARDKVRVFVSDEGDRAAGAGQVRGVMEHDALLEVGALENLREGLNTAASRREGAGTLAARLACGPIQPAGPPSPMFTELTARLQVAGIRATLQDGTLQLAFSSPCPTVCGRPPCLRGENDSLLLKLARPVPHPWLRERSLTHIGAYGALEQDDTRWPSRFAGPPQLHGEQEVQPAEAYAALVEANNRLSRLLASQAPESLARDAQARLESRVRAFFDLLLTPRHLRFHERMLYSARAVIAPGADLRVDQIGLADEIAWALFGPLAARELGDAEAVRLRSAEATRVLDEVMARSWVIVNRAPTLTPTAHLAFRPLRDPGSVIRLHPLACPLLDGDFDGDQVALFLPLTEGAQREAGERLTIAAHLARDPGLVQALIPPPEALWGLAHLGLTEEGRREVAQLAGLDARALAGPITQSALLEAMAGLLRRAGAEVMLDVLDRLIRRGFDAVRDSGASISPTIGTSLYRPPAPKGQDAIEWAAYHEELAEQILAGMDYADLDLGAQRLAVSVRARGRQHLPALIGPLGPLQNAEGDVVVVRNSRVEGLTPDELYATAAGARVGLARYLQRWEKMAEETRQRPQPERFTLLARARHANYPGIVFARAAANGEIDPLADVESRLLVGL